MQHGEVKWRHCCIRMLKIVNGTTVMPAEPRDIELWMEKKINILEQTFC